MAGVYIFLALIVICLILAVVIFIQAGVYKKMKRENDALHESFRDAGRKTERLRTALGRQADAEVEAHEEKKSLAGTADLDLVHRANDLFGGVPDEPRTRSRSG
jgi:predicted Holliday junction resolvase-like endonuclease